MAKATIGAVSLALLFAMQAHSSAAGQADDANGLESAAYSGDAAVLHTSPQSSQYVPTRTLWIQRHDGALSMDRVDSCNYTTRVKKRNEPGSPDDFPGPVACWAHRWNSGLQTSY